MQELQREFKNKREALGMTQIQLGEKCKLSPSAISQFENGKINWRVDTCFRVGDALKIDPAYIIREFARHIGLPLHRTSDM